MDSYIGIDTIQRTHPVPPTSTPGALCGNRLLPGPTTIVVGGAALDAMTKCLFNRSARYGRAVVGYWTAMTSSGATHTGEFEEFEDGEVLGLWRWSRIIGLKDLVGISEMLATC